MEFLDKPIVQFILMCIALVMLVGWVLTASLFQTKVK